MYLIQLGLCLYEYVYLCFFISQKRNRRMLAPKCTVFLLFVLEAHLWLYLLALEPVLFGKLGFLLFASVCNS